MNDNIINSLIFVSRRHSLFVKGVALVLAGLFVLMQVLIPMFGEAYRTAATAKDKKAQLEELSSQVTFLTNLDATVLKQRIGVLDGVLPRTKDVLLYLTTIDGLSKDLSLSLGTIKLSPGEVSSSSAELPTEASGKASKAESVEAVGIGSLDTELSVSGTQYSVYAFLRGIEQTAPLMRVQDARISKLSEDSFSLNVMLSMMYAGAQLDSLTKGKTLLFDASEEELFKRIVEMRSYQVPAGDTESIPTGKSNLFESITVQP